jgi:hypothetical protein
VVVGDGVRGEVAQIPQGKGPLRVGLGLSVEPEADLPVMAVLELLNEVFADDDVGADVAVEKVVREPDEELP